MLGKKQFSRRIFLASGSATFVSQLAAAGAYYDVPVITKRVEKLFKIQGCKEPNDLQFAPDGALWVLDQVDPNKVFQVGPRTVPSWSRFRLNRSMAAESRTGRSALGRFHQITQNSRGRCKDR